MNDFVYESELQFILNDCLGFSGLVPQKKIQDQKFHDFF